MFLHYGIAVIGGLAAALFLLAFYVFRKNMYAAAEKGLSVALALLSAFVYFCDYDALSRLFAGESLSGAFCGVSAGFICLWLTAAGGIFLLLYPFFAEKTVWAQPLIALPLAAYALDAAFLNDFIAAFSGHGAGEWCYRSILIAAQTGLGFGYSLFALVTRAGRLRGTFCVRTLFAAVGMLVCCLPHYTFQLIFDPRRYTAFVKPFGALHLVYVLPAAVIAAALWAGLRKRDEAEKRAVLLYYALAGLYGYVLVQKMPLFRAESISVLPLHLCNLMMYLSPLCVAFNLKKLYSFVYYFGIVGALVALCTPIFAQEPYTGTVFYYTTVHYFRHHYAALCVPVAAVATGLFPRPRLKDFPVAAIIFTAYFAVVLVCDVVLVNFDAKVDFFFLNYSFVAEKLGALGAFLRKFVFTLKGGGLNFVFYPLYQAACYVAALAFGLASGAVYSLLAKLCRAVKRRSARHSG